jgi:hypothetical protein
MRIPINVAFAPLSRRTARWIVLWVFGLATTTLLIGLWGRAVSADEGTLRDGLRAAVHSDVVAAEMYQWLVEALAVGSGADRAEVASVLEDIGRAHATEVAVETVIDRTVDAALAPPGMASTIDVGAALQPVGMEMAQRLASAGVDVQPDIVTAVLEQLEPVVVAADYGAGIGGAVSTARSVLTTVAVVASLVLVASGTAAVLLADDRLVMTRSLVSRIAVSAFTFAVVTRIASWALDPEGGRSPIAAGGAVVLRSNGGLLIGIAAAGVTIVTALGVVIVRRRNGLRSGDGSPVAVVLDDEEDPTGERVLIHA